MDPLQDSSSISFARKVSAGLDGASWAKATKERGAGVRATRRKWDSHFSVGLELGHLKNQRPRRGNPVSKIDCGTARIGRIPHGFPFFWETARHDAPAST